MAMSKNKSNQLIVWLDENIASPDCCRQMKKAFTTTTDPEHKLFTSIDEQDISNLIRDDSELEETSFLEVPTTFKLFSHIEPCLKTLLENAGKMRIFFITSGALGKYIVPRILTDHQEIFKDKNGKLYEDSIYIFCADMEKHSEWAIDYLELDCIKMENDDQAILARLTRDIAKYFVSQGKELVVNNDILSLQRAIQYFIWAKELYNKAQLVVKAYSHVQLLKNIDQLIIETESKINQMINDIDDDKMGEEN